MPAGSSAAAASVYRVALPYQLAGNAVAIGSNFLTVGVADVAGSEVTALAVIGEGDAGAQCTIEQIQWPCGCVGGHPDAPVTCRRPPSPQVARARHINRLWR